MQEKYYLFKRRRLLETEQCILQCVAFSIYDVPGTGSGSGGSGSVHSLLLQICRQIDIRLTDSGNYCSHKSVPSVAVAPQDSNVNDKGLVLLMPRVVEMAWAVLLRMHYEPAFYAEFTCSAADTIAAVDHTLATVDSPASLLPWTITPFICAPRSIALSCLISALQCLAGDQPPLQQHNGLGHQRFDQCPLLSLSSSLSSSSSSSSSGLGTKRKLVEIELEGGNSGGDRRVRGSGSFVSGGASTADSSGHLPVAFELLRWVLQRIHLFTMDIDAITSDMPCQSVDNPTPNSRIVSDLQVLLVWLAGPGSKCNSSN